jgi:uncharacterized membrane protein
LLRFAANAVTDIIHPGGCMAHCTKCGAMVAENSAFCGSCGAPQGAAAAPAGPGGAGVGQPPAVATTQSGLAENVAGTLSYVLGWITGLIFYLIDKRPYVRFHAAQSIVVFGALHILVFVLGMFSVYSFFSGGFTIGWTLHMLVELVALVLWILLMVKAYQGERFRVPFAADLAEKLFGKAA